jgi:hypothetical protein
MLNIDQSKFIFAVNNIELKAISLKHELNKSTNSWFKSIYELFNYEGKKLNSIGAECCNLLDRIEKLPIKFGCNEYQIEEQKQYYTACIKTAKTIISLLSSSKSQQVKTSLDDLIYRVTGLQYRIEGINGGKDKTSIDLALIEKLSKIAVDWKINEPLIVNKSINADDIKILEQISTYPEFVEVLFENKSLQKTFFNWALRDGNNIDHFIQYPAMAARLKSSYLASRVGRLGKYLIQKQVKENSEVQEKVFVLPFYRKGQKTEYISLMDESKEVEIQDYLGNNKSFTIKKVLNVFSNKNNEIGELEFFRDGIMLWNSHKLGGIDLTREEWWKQLPILKEIDHENIEKLACSEVKIGEWVVFAKSSRTTPDMDLDLRHGFMEIAIPTEKGTYLICPFGNFPESFPNTWLDVLLFLGNTFRAKISFPDENFFYTHRQHASMPMILSHEVAIKFMKNLQKELIQAKHGHKIFQFGAENCAYWSQYVLSMIESLKHNFYETDYVKSYPLNPLLKWIFRFFRTLPLVIRNQAIYAVDILFGSYRGVWVFENRKKVFKSHKMSPVRNRCIICQPAHLHHQIQNGELKGYINLGNC